MSKHSYNPWPLGALPDEFKRKEPELILQQGYHWDDPRDIVDIFESKLARYSGSKYAVVTDSCSNALFLALTVSNVRNQEIEIPSQTYVSVPFQIHHAGAKPKYVDLQWSGIYQLGETNVWDSAARFTKDMYVGGGGLQCLSFQIKKRLPIGRGGAILTDSLEIYKKLKLLSYDGRDLLLPYSDTNHVSQIGWHMYMTPEDAARGILLMDMLPERNDDTMTWNHYPDLRQWEVTRGLAPTSGQG